MSFLINSRSIATVIGIGAVTLLFSSCDKDSNPTSSANDDKPPLTESEGTIHQGNYFPLKEGNTLTHAGSMTTAMNQKMTASNGGQSMSESMDTSYTTTISETMTVGAPTQITYSGNQITVYPISTVSTMSDFDDEPTTGFTYYEETNDAIYQRAASMEETQVEAENVLFLKKPLVVGDSWESNPDFDISDLGDLSDLMNLGDTDLSTSMQMDTKSTTYVIGKETISINGASTPVIRLDQRMELTISANDQTFGNISITMNGTTKHYLQEDVGIVKEIIDMTMKMTMNMEEEGSAMTIDMTLDMDGALTLSTMQLNKRRVIEPQNLSPQQKAMIKAGYRAIRALR